LIKNPGKIIGVIFSSIRSGSGALVFLYIFPHLLREMGQTRICQALLCDALSWHGQSDMFQISGQNVHGAVRTIVKQMSDSIATFASTNYWGDECAEKLIVFTIFKQDIQEFTRM
jgi:hypothetical protein